MDVPETALGLAVALGIGLLVGLERERHKGRGPGRGAAGVRTFVLVSLLGGLSMATGIDGLVVAAAVFVAALAVISYGLGSREDPGITSEVALVTTFALGALAQRDAALAAGVAVVVTILLASRAQLHRLVRDLISEQELHDLLLFTAAAVVIYPLLPNRDIGPYDGLNPHTVWRLVVVVMAAGGAGHIAVRFVGPRFGLPLTGLAGGFVSSAATIASMGVVARENRALLRGAVAGAILSSVATVIQLAVVLAVASTDLLYEVAGALVAASAAASIFAVAALWRLPNRLVQDESLERKSAFDLAGVVVFASAITLVTLFASVMEGWIGPGAAPVTAGISGFADAHAAAAGMAALVTDERIGPSGAAIGVLLGLTTNAVTKAVAAVSTGGRRYALPVMGGLVAMIGGAWAGLLVQQQVLK